MSHSKERIYAFLTRNKSRVTSYIIMQQTIKKSITFSDVGLHSGKKCNLTIKPAPANTGIIFKRIDLSDNNEIPLCLNNVNLEKSKRRTVLKNKVGVEISSVEHLLSALNGLGIDNALIDLDSEEVPALKGNSLEFVDKIMDAGVKSLCEKKNHFKISSPTLFYENDTTVIGLPDEHFRVTYIVDYQDKVVGIQSKSIIVTPQNYINEIAPARTFGFEKEIDELLNKGLIKGGSLDSALIIDENDYINPNKEMPDEVVRHKIMDIIGDLYILGKPIIGHIIAYKAGHYSHIRFLKELDKRQGTT